MTRLPLMMIVQPGLTTPDPVAAARAAVAAGVGCVQVRGQVTDRELHDLAVQLLGALAGTAAQVLVNGRFDIAVGAGAHGVHLKDDGLSPARVREAARRAGAPRGFIVGVSTHDAAGLVRARAEGADHATFGPLRDAHGKPGRGEAWVAATMTEARAAGGLPQRVYLLGGVGPEDAAFARELAGGDAVVGLAGIRMFSGEASEGEIPAGGARRTGESA